MSFLAYEGICVDTNLDPVWSVVGFIVKAIWIGVPILLIIFGMIDLGKAVVASKEDEVKKAWKAFGRRLLVAIAVFAVVWAVGAVLGLASRIGGSAMGDYNQNSWKACWCKISSGTDHMIDDEGNCVKK